MIQFLIIEDFNGFNRNQTPFKGEVFPLSDLYQSFKLFYLYIYHFNGFILNFGQDVGAINSTIYKYKQNQLELFKDIDIV